MELYVGGYAQGKLEYVLNTHKGQDLYLADGRELSAVWPPDIDIPRGKRLVIYGFHLWVKRLLEEGNYFENLAQELEQGYPECIIISDEVGNGVVPVEQADREYREQVGRSLIVLAAKAERVERVICGLGQRLK